MIIKGSDIFKIEASYKDNGQMFTNSYLSAMVVAENIEMAISLFKFENRLLGDLEIDKAHRIYNEKKAHHKTQIIFDVAHTEQQEAAGEKY